MTPTPETPGDETPGTQTTIQGTPPPGSNLTEGQITQGSATLSEIQNSLREHGNLDLGGRLMALEQWATNLENLMAQPELKGAVFHAASTLSELPAQLRNLESRVQALEAEVNT